MQEKIGQAAGQIWGILASTSEPVSVSALSKKTDLSSQMTALGLGWLARENKLRFEEKGKTLLVSLVGSGACCS
jgi:DNA-binding transcriptional regulator GbsR (MarR family)